MARRDEPLYEEDVVEVFIDPFGGGTTYYEFEVSPRGVLFDALIHNTLDGNKEVDTAWIAEGFQAEVTQGTMTVGLSMMCGFHLPIWMMQACLSLVRCGIGMYSGSMMIAKASALFGVVGNWECQFSCSSAVWGACVCEEVRGRREDKRKTRLFLWKGWSLF